MKQLAICAAVVVLGGCATVTDTNSRDVQQHSVQRFPAAQIRTLRVENFDGAIDVEGSAGPAVVIDTTKYAGRQDAIDNTQVVIDRNGPELDAHTHYLKSGWFSSRGAGVDYVVKVPPQTRIHLANVSGPVTVRGISGNVEIQEVSGKISAALGIMNADRDVRINTVNGGTEIALARASNVTVDVKSVSGGVAAFFPFSGSKGFVGQTLHGRLGAGEGTLEVNAVSGAVAIRPM